jgi:ketosteroid isomerase-like protein
MLTAHSACRSIPLVLGVALAACGAAPRNEPAPIPSAVSAAPPICPPAAGSARDEASNAPSEDVAALIKRQSQEFSDASATNDIATLGRYLDDNVVFINEDGAIATKKDLTSDPTPVPKKGSNTLVQSDFAVQVHGNVAVTSFTDNSTQQFHGQTLHASFLSTEVWLKEADGWRMISSQTLAVPDDPPAVTLPTKVLDEYAGNYQAGPDFVLKIARSGDELTGVVGAGKPYPIKAELRDVLFTPGQPRTRRIVLRDAKGKVTGLRVRREGHDIELKRVG